MNPRIIDYKTIRAFESEKTKFDYMVLESICAGWQPFGSPYTVTTGAHTTFFQAMVRFEEESKPEPQKETTEEPKEKTHSSTTNEH